MKKPDLKVALAEVDRENQRIKALADLLVTGGMSAYGIGRRGPQPPGHKAEFIITLSRVESKPRPPEATITACKVCHAACWITPKSRAALAALPGARALCVECVVRECREEGKQP